MNINYLYENTDLTLQQIADTLGLKLTYVWKYVKNTYSSSYRKARKVNSYSKSKIGDKNPMSGKTSEKHHNYIGDISDGKGYLMRIKPEWYTGRAGSKHIFVHHIVICEHLGIYSIPKGWVVHHCDFNPHNNDISNLVLLKMGDHMKLHRYLEGATTISKESTLKWVETYGTPWCDDIVCSIQECIAAKAGEE
jgi:hypothetical protein